MHTFPITEMKFLTVLGEPVSLVPQKKPQGGGGRPVDSYQYLTWPYGRQGFKWWKSQEKGRRTLLLMEALEPYQEGGRRWQSRAVLREKGHRALIFKWHQRRPHCALPQDSQHLSSPWPQRLSLGAADNTQLLPPQTQMKASLLKKERIMTFSLFYICGPADRNRRQEQALIIYPFLQLSLLSCYSLFML